MPYNFDELVDRTNTKSVKHDGARTNKMGYNAIPLWIADMDFRAPDSIRNAIIERGEHGIFGYSTPDDDYFGAVKSWFSTRHGWDTEPQWLVTTPGVLPAIAAVINAVTSPGDAVLLQYPSYDRFNMLVEKNNRRVVRNSLVLTDGKYVIDFEDFERQIVRNNVKLFILCSPHNPIGRVWTREELAAMGDICARHSVFVVSDEIFCDFVYPPNVHTVFLDANPGYAARTIICTAPTKTFNMSGMAISNIFIPDDDVRDDVNDVLTANGLLGSSVAAMLACQAGYEAGAQWLDELLVYLKGNVDFVRGFLRANMPQVELIEPEGTYLLWLDFRKLGLWANELRVFSAYDAGVILSGEMGGDGFLRINAACPRALLEKALSQLSRAAAKLS
jgi:cystathionine beta-lyase